MDDNKSCHLKFLLSSRPVSRVLSRCMSCSFIRGTVTINCLIKGINNSLSMWIYLNADQGGYGQNKARNRIVSKVRLRNSNWESYRHVNVLRDNKYINTLRAIVWNFNKKLQRITESISLLADMCPPNKKALVLTLCPNLPIKDLPRPRQTKSGLSKYYPILEPEHFPFKQLHTSWQELTIKQIIIFW